MRAALTLGDKPDASRSGEEAPRIARFPSCSAGEASHRAERKDVEDRGTAGSVNEVAGRRKGRAHGARYTGRGAIGVDGFADKCGGGVAVQGSSELNTELAPWISYLEIEETSPCALE